MSKNKNGLPDDVNADSPNPGESRSNDDGIITESAGGVKQAPPADPTGPSSLTREGDGLTLTITLPAPEWDATFALFNKQAGPHNELNVKGHGESALVMFHFLGEGPDTLRVLAPEGTGSFKLTLPPDAPEREAQLATLLNESSLTMGFEWHTTLAPQADGVHMMLAGHDLRLSSPEWTDDYKAGTTRESLLQEVARENDELKVRRALPTTLHQQTFAEIRTVQQGLSDGPTAGTPGSAWAYSPPERCAIHTVPTKDNKDKWPLQTRFDPTEIPQKWAIYEPSGDEGKDADALFALLRETGTDAAMLMNVAVALAIKDPKHLYELDLFVTAAGEAPRSKTQWREAREKTWLRLRTIMAMRPIGRRIGRYYDRHTREYFDLQVNDPLLRIVHTVDPVQPSLDNPTPVAISLDGGAWIEKYRTDPRVLTYFGNIVKLSQITSGRPSGAWARCIGMNLNQAWRESAKDATVTTRDGNRQAKNTEWAFTRRELLDGMVTVSPEHHYQAMLDSANPSRARRAFDEAMNILQERGVVGKWYCLSPTPAGRKAWKATWLDEEIVAAPGREGVTQTIEIATAQRKALARLKKNKAAKKKAKAAEADSKKPE